MLWPKGNLSVETGQTQTHPSGAMLLFCCAWVVLCYLLLTGKVASAEQPLRVN